MVSSLTLASPMQPGTFRLLTMCKAWGDSTGWHISDLLLGSPATTPSPYSEGRLRNSLFHTEGEVGVAYSSRISFRWSIHLFILETDALIQGQGTVLPHYTQSPMRAQPYRKELQRHWIGNSGCGMGNHTFPFLSLRWRCDCHHQSLFCEAVWTPGKMVDSCMEEESYQSTLSIENESADTLSRSPVSLPLSHDYRPRKRIVDHNQVNETIIYIFQLWLRGGSDPQSMYLLRHPSLFSLMEFWITTQQRTEENSCSSSPVISCMRHMRSVQWSFCWSLNDGAPFIHHLGSGKGMLMVVLCAHSTSPHSID